ncbi:MAG: energy-coupling factor transporter ATPase [Clostridia bacterium]|nr:energy-coupling factor transporter ATPase [Clostridia bacterium]
MASHFIEARGLGFSYDAESESDAVVALDDISLTIDEGEYIAILGHNGSGKSTLAKLFNLILTPSRGELILDGKTVTSEGLSDDEIYEIRKKIGMVFQNPDNQLVATVVEEDVAFGPENLGVPREELRRRVDEALATVGMTEYARHAPHKLSGGQKQRVAIAGVLAMMPRCIIFDESTAMLDPLGRREVTDVMERLNREQNMTVLHITHYMEEAARASRIIVISDGKILLDGTPKEVFSSVEPLLAAGLETPQGTELIHELRMLGFDLPKGCTTVGECTDAIFSLFKEKKDNNDV